MKSIRLPVTETKTGGCWVPNNKALLKYKARIVRAFFSPCGFETSFI